MKSEILGNIAKEWEKKKAGITVSLLGLFTLILLAACANQANSENLSHGVHRSYGRERPNLLGQFIVPLSDRELQGLGPLVKMVVNLQSCFDQNGDAKCQPGTDRMLGNVAVDYGFLTESGEEVYPPGLEGTTSPYGDGSRDLVPYPDGTSILIKMKNPRVPYARDLVTGGVLVAIDPEVKVHGWDLHPKGGDGTIDQLDVSIFFMSSSFDLTIPFEEITPVVPQG